MPTGSAAIAIGAVEDLTPINVLAQLLLERRELRPESMGRAPEPATGWSGINDSRLHMATVPQPISLVTQAAKPARQFIRLPARL